jgi:two-component system OmpR family sensor kinase
VDNLLANVRAHTPPDTPCDVTLEKEALEAVLSIADTGPGVAEDVLHRLGDRFFRVDDARTRQTGGSGLGLSIVRAIVGAHGGSIVVTHNEPHGLKVDVRLPLTHDLRPSEDQ